MNVILPYASDLAGKSQRNSHIIGTVVAQLQRNGIQADAKRVKDKIRSLKKKYEEERAKCTSTGSETSTWQWYNQMAMMFPDSNRLLDERYDSVPAVQEVPDNEEDSVFQDEEHIDDQEYTDDNFSSVLTQHENEYLEDSDDSSNEQRTTQTERVNASNLEQREPDDFTVGTKESSRKTPSVAFRENLMDEIMRANRHSEAQIEIANKLQGN